MSTILDRAKTYLSAFEEMTLYDGHPAVIVREMADRIEALERERDEARAACVALRDERDNLSSIVSSGIDDVAGAALDDAETALAASQAEVTRLKEALRKMHRRAQSAEGQAGAARYELEMWASHPVMKTAGGYLAREVAKSGLKGLNRRARSVLEEQKP